MKLIGITGSFGKTSVAEIVYQYLLFKGYNTSLYSSNGLFLNGLTRDKDFLQTTLHHIDLGILLKEDEENNVDYAVIEITAESVKRNDKVHQYEYEIIALTNFNENLHNHFDSREDYYYCKRNILESNKTKKILLRLDDPNYSWFSDIKHKTFGYTDNANYQTIVLDNTIDGLKLKCDGVSFETNLITAYHARNMVAAIAILKELQIFDINSFITFAKNVFIRGRFEKYYCNDKDIIIDTGFGGIDLVLNGLEKTLDNTNYKMIFSNYHYDNITDWVKNSRKRVGKHLRRSQYIYLTSPNDNPNEESIFINEVMDQSFKNYKYIPNIKEACAIALSELEKDEVLIIIAREHYRDYRKVLEEIKDFI